MVGKNSNSKVSIYYYIIYKYLQILNILGWDTICQPDYRSLQNEYNKNKYDDNVKLL